MDGVEIPTMEKKEDQIDWRKRIAVRSELIAEKKTRLANRPGIWAVTFRYTDKRFEDSELNGPYLFSTRALLKAFVVEYAAPVFEESDWFKQFSTVDPCSEDWNLMEVNPWSGKWKIKRDYRVLEKVALCISVGGRSSFCWTITFIEGLDAPFVSEPIWTDIAL